MIVLDGQACGLPHALYGSWLDGFFVHVLFEGSVDLVCPVEAVFWFVEFVPGYHA